MSKEQSFRKALALSLLLTLPHQQSVLAANDFLSEQVIGSGGLVANDTAGDGGNATANHRIEGDVNGSVEVSITGGNGNSWGLKKGGDAANTLTVAKSSTISSDIKLSAQAGRSDPEFIGGAADSRLIVIGGTVVAAKDILITSVAGDGGASVYRSSGTTPSIGSAFAGGQATAIGIKSDSGLLAVTAQDLSASASGGNGGHSVNGNINCSGADIGGAGGAAAAYGLSTSGNSGTITLRDLKVDALGGSAGNSTNSGNINGVVGGAGGDAAAYGWSGTGSELSISMNSMTVKAKGGASTMGSEGGRNTGNKSNGGDGGRGGEAAAYAFHAQADNKLTISMLSGISVSAEGAAGSAGGSEYNLGKAGSGGDGGAATAYALHAAANSQLSGSLGDINVNAQGGNGGDGKAAGPDMGYLRQGAGGDGGAGGEALATGIYAQDAVLDIEAKDLIITASGGWGGLGGDSIYNIIGIGGSSGAAAAYGLSTISASGQLKLVSIQSTAKGGSLSAESSYKGAGEGGNALAKALLLKQDSQLTVSVIQDVSASATGAAGGSAKTGHKQITTAKNGGQASATAVELDSSNLTLDIAGDLLATARGGRGGHGAPMFDNISWTPSPGGDAGNGGIATAIGANIANAAQLTVTMRDLRVTSTGGAAGASGNYEHQPAALGGAAKAIGLAAETDGVLQVTLNNATVSATGGQGAIGTNYFDNSVNSSSIKGGEGSTGADAQASAVYGRYSELRIEAKELSITAIGGKGGNGGSVYGDGGDAGVGGAATAYGLALQGGTAVVELSKINTQALGGAGGDGGDGGLYGNNGSGGNGSDGGAATAYGINISEAAQLTVTLDSLIVDAQGGAVGAAGIGHGTGVNGAAGTKFGTATAYGIYAVGGSQLALHATNSAIDIGVSATGDSASSAYSLYASGDSKVLFGSDVNLNLDKTLVKDNTSITYLDNSTLGFVDSLDHSQAVGRQLNGGVLQLKGSNTLRFATDLHNNTADKMQFDSLAAGSTDSPQYITVAYDKSFDGSNDNSIVGKATVLNITELNGNDLSQFLGQKSEFDSPLNQFSATPTVEVDGNSVNITRIDFKTIGASESVMIASDADMALRGIWRAESNNLMKRMGELRNEQADSKGGVWARYYGGQLNGDGGYGRSIGQNYNGFQAGVDKVQDYKDGKLVTGLLVNHIQGSSEYAVGSGKVSSTGLGLYTSWIGDKGHYVDVVARMSKLSNRFHLVDKSGNRADGDYSKWAYGLSAEYGYRKALSGGWFVEPQIELTLSHINSGEYTMSNGLQIQQDALSSFVARMGVLAGRTFTHQGGVGNTYVKASVLHEFSGNGSAQAYYQGNGLSIQSGDMGGTWCELGIGANVPLSSKSNLYLDAIKTFGSKMQSNWQINAGVRFAF